VVALRVEGKGTLANDNSRGACISPQFVTRSLVTGYTKVHDIGVPGFGPWITRAADRV